MRPTSPPPIGIEERLLSRERPDEAPTGWQTWKNLLFLHWKVEVNGLRQLLPDSLELDLFDDQALVGLVPFEMHAVQPSWLPAPFAFNFLEANVRTYVTYRGEPGVFFFSLEASSWLAVKAARIGWSLPYHHARMSTTRGEMREYISSRRRGDAKLDLRYRVGASTGTSAPGTLDFFLIERYLLFSMHGNSVMRGQVHHAPYPLQDVQLEQAQQSLLSTSNIQTLRSEPDFVHFSAGVDVEIFGPHRH